MIIILSTALIASCSGGLITFFITTLSQRKSIENIASNAIITAIQTHSISCEVSQLKGALIFLVSEAGGNPKDYGLL